MANITNNTNLTNSLTMGGYTASITTQTFPNTFYNVTIQQPCGGYHLLSGSFTSHEAAEAAAYEYLKEWAYSH